MYGIFINSWKPVHLRFYLRLIIYISITYIICVSFVYTEGPLQAFCFLISIITTSLGKVLQNPIFILVLPTMCDMFILLLYSCTHFRKGYVLLGIVYVEYILLWNKLKYSKELYYTRILRIPGPVPFRVRVYCIKI